MESVERESLDLKLEKVGNILRLTGWIGFCVQIGFGAISLLMVVFAGQPHTFLNKQEMTKTKQDNRYYLYAETLDGKASQPYSLDRNALWEIARPQSVTQHRP